MIYDKIGRRKYLTITERRAFVEATSHLSPEARTLCLALVYTGARISEILALTPEQVDTEAGVIVIECLKKRKRGVFRGVPVPPGFLQRLEDVHKLSLAQRDPLLRTERIWSCSRTTAWAWVKQVMRIIGAGPGQAMPKALRHAFGVGATQKNVPLNVVQKWMGHARLTTTALYADAIGDEERLFAARIWD